MSCVLAREGRRAVASCVWNIRTNGEASRYSARFIIFFYNNIRTASSPPYHTYRFVTAYFFYSSTNTILESGANIELVSSRLRKTYAPLATRRPSEIEETGPNQIMAPATGVVIE